MLLVNITEQASLHVIFALITEDIPVAPPCCLARLLLKYIVDLPVNQILQLLSDEMAPPLSEAALLKNFTVEFSQKKI